MCGRYALNASASQVIEQFQLVAEEELRNSNRRYEKEVYPTKIEEVVARINNSNILESKPWGVSKLPINGVPLKDQVNVATIEKLVTSPLWSKALKKHRLLIPATSYFEWKEVEKYTNEKYEIFSSSQEIFAMAGLNIIYEDSDKKINDCFVIITTEANDKLKSIHHRQPGIIKKENYLSWLKNETINPKELIHQFDCNEMDYDLIGSKSKTKKQKNPSNQPTLFDLDKNS